jgi:hypothetical protein
MASAGKKKKKKKKGRKKGKEIILSVYFITVFILDLKGKVLISRNYRGDIPMSAVEKFMPLVKKRHDDDDDDKVL